MFSSLNFPTHTVFRPLVLILISEGGNVYICMFFFAETLKIELTLCLEPPAKNIKLIFQLKLILC